MLLSDPTPTALLPVGPQERYALVRLVDTTGRKACDFRILIDSEDCRSSIALLPKRRHAVLPHLLLGVATREYGWLYRAYWEDQRVFVVLRFARSENNSSACTRGARPGGA